jgi:NAD-dependent SIR2 family protein deacetylase
MENSNCGKKKMKCKGRMHINASAMVIRTVVVWFECSLPLKFKYHWQIIKKRRSEPKNLLPIVGVG